MVRQSFRALGQRPVHANCQVTGTARPRFIHLGGKNHFIDSVNWYDGACIDIHVDLGQNDILRVKESKG